MGLVPRAALPAPEASPCPWPSGSASLVAPSRGQREFRESGGKGAMSRRARHPDPPAGPVAPPAAPPVEYSPAVAEWLSFLADLLAAEILRERRQEERPA